MTLPLDSHNAVRKIQEPRLALPTQPLAIQRSITIALVFYNHGRSLRSRRGVVVPLAWTLLSSATVLDGNLLLDD